MRWWMLVGVLASAPAMAGQVTKDDVAAAKDAWKEEVKEGKAIEKISKAWIKGYAKENQKKMHAADADLLEWRRKVLADLRDDGVSTKEVGVDGGAPAQQKLRDIVVELRDMQVRFDDETAPKGMYKKKQELLQAAVAEMAVRADRYEKRYEKLKERLKAQKKG